MRTAFCSPGSFLPGSAIAFLMAACAVPADDVQVATMPMRDALDLSRQPAIPSTTRRSEFVPHLVTVTTPPGAPRPLLSAPDVRLAYLYEWVDLEGNKHFGEWVAIPVAGFNWIMSNGEHPPIDGSGGQAPPAREPQN